MSLVLMCLALSCQPVEPERTTSRQPAIIQAAAQDQPESHAAAVSGHASRVSVKPVAAPGHSHIVRMLVTAYCPCRKCCGAYSDGMTASGRRIDAASMKFVAADTSRLPFGSSLIVPGYADGKAVEVLDRGSSIRGDRLDVFFASHDEALQWGRKWLDVKVLEVKGQPQVKVPVRAE